MTGFSVEIEVLLEDDRPEATVCLGTPPARQPTARCVVSPDMWSLVDRTECSAARFPALSAVEEAGAAVPALRGTNLPEEADDEEGDRACCERP
jgi:hypothetical protein